jgi:rhodanese-related sulfurtransferase
MFPREGYGDRNTAEGGRFMRTRWLLVALALSLLMVGLAACRHLPPARTYADPGQLSTLISQKIEPYFLVDVRTTKEYSSGYIPTAVNIPLDQLRANLPTADLGALIIVYCQSGGRSSQAAALLMNLGYTRVIDFGSISRWGGALVDSAMPGE